MVVIIIIRIEVMQMFVDSKQECSCRYSYTYPQKGRDDRCAN